MNVQKLAATAAVLIAPMLFVTAPASAITARQSSMQAQGRYTTSAGVPDGYTLTPGGLYTSQNNAEQGAYPYSGSPHRNRYNGAY